jgi:hypothetical protein
LGRRFQKVGLSKSLSNIVRGNGLRYRGDCMQEKGNFTQGPLPRGRYLSLLTLSQVLRSAHFCSAFPYSLFIKPVPIKGEKQIPTSH